MQSSSSIESLETVYRVRRFYFPKGDRDFHFACLFALSAKIPNPNPPTEFMLEFMRSRNSQENGLNIYIEPCKVVKITGTTIIVQSLDLDPMILKLFPDFRDGGSFTLAKGKLQKEGVARHTRHNEHFFLEVPTRNIALSHSPQCLIKIRRSLENAKPHEHAIKKIKAKEFRDAISSKYA